MPQTRSQQIAQRVYQQVNSQISKDEKFIKDYGRLCNRFPVLILENGLAQALGFLQGKAGGNRQSAEGVFFSHLAGLLNQSPDHLLQGVLAAPLNEYRRLTREALGAAVWYKRFAQGVLGVDATGEAIEEGQGDGPDAP